MSRILSIGFFVETVTDVVSEADELVFSAFSSSESTLLAVQLAGAFHLFTHAGC